MYTAFITGCAVGFGARLARRLHTDGHRVFATDPHTQGLEGRLGGPSERLHVLELDVRDPASVSAATRAALAVAPVDLLVNNAGYALFGTVEEADLDAVRDQFEVNLFGAARVTQALLPSLRATGGAVVQLSSVAGRTVFPESGYYAATKYALEALSEALFQETCTFGVRTRLIEPGAFATQFYERAAEVSGAPPEGSAYAHLRAAWGARKEEVLEPPQDPDLVIQAVLDALVDPAPFLRVAVGADAKRILEVRDGLGPDRWSRLAADRAGLRAPHGPGEVPYPGDLAAADDAACAAAELAARHRHLEHWRQDATGREALASLLKS